MGRKTLEVGALIATINRFIACNPTDRKVLCQLAEKVLHDTQNYQGFRYQSGYKPGDPDFDEFNRVYNLPR